MLDDTRRARGSVRPLKRLLAGLPLLACGSSLALTACGGEGGLVEVDPSLGTVSGVAEQTLGAPPSWGMPFPGGDVEYCFQPGKPGTSMPQPGSFAWNQAVLLTEEAMAKFEAIPDAAIDFYGGGVCADYANYRAGTLDGQLRILVLDAGAQTLRCDGGQQGVPLPDDMDTLSCGGSFGDETIVKFGVGYNPPAVGILHELGHVLGFLHEYSRRDSPQDQNCDPQTPEGTHSGITPYDPYSVMNATYCHTRDYLSEMDEAGFAFMYPGHADVLTVNAPFTFLVPGGVITAAADSEPIEFVLRTRGVDEIRYSEAEWFNVNASPDVSLGTGSSITIGQARMSSYATPMVRAEFTDRWGRFRATPELMVQRSPGAATALLLSAL